MHFLYGHERLANLWYRNRGLICLIIQRVFIPNIHKVTHKLIRWWGKDKFAVAWGAPVKDSNKKKLHGWKESAKLNTNFN
jgi:hypothetical protein